MSQYLRCEHAPNRRDIRASADQHRPGAAVFRPYVRVRSTLLERGERWRHGTSRTLGPLTCTKRPSPFAASRCRNLQLVHDALVEVTAPGPVRELWHLGAWAATYLGVANAVA